MSIDKYSTLTSGICKLKMEDFEVEHFNPERIKTKETDKFLVLENALKSVSDFDFAVNAMYDSGFRIVISAGFSDLFCIKAMSVGLLPIEISLSFFNKILTEFSILQKLKLFIDTIGQEIMIVKTGEKEFFELTEYNKECLLNGFNEVDYLYCVWDEINCCEKENYTIESIEYALE